MVQLKLRVNGFEKLVKSVRNGLMNAKADGYIYASILPPNNPVRMEIKFDYIGDVDGVPVFEAAP